MPTLGPQHDAASDRPPHRASHEAAPDRAPHDPAPDRAPHDAAPDRAQPDAASDAEPHRARSWAESFGSDAARYDRTRPSYPDAAIAAIVAASPGLDVVDVGCGTGIAARQFRSAGCRVLGVDVDARMADLARQGGVEVEVATFEEWDRAGRVFDAVVSGQAWHWVDPAVGAVRAADALRPGGRLAAFWNVFLPPAEVADAFAAVYRRVVPESRFGRSMPSGLDGIGAAGAFGAPEQWRYDWQRSYTRDEWLDQVPTFGGHNQLPPAGLEALVEGIGAAIDRVGGSFITGYATVVVTAARR